MNKSDQKLHRQTSQVLQQTRSHSSAPQLSCRPVVLCIGGSDCSGLAGLQMDGRILQAMDVHQACVITAITAQNTQGVFANTATSIADCQAQFDAAISLGPLVIKIGLLANLEQLLWLSQTLKDHEPQGLQVIYDPVTISSSGDNLATPQVAENLPQLLQHCQLLTPNLPEAQALLDKDLNTDHDLYEATRDLHKLGLQWVYLKGGHSKREIVCDVISHEKNVFALEQPRQTSPHLRGTGCALASRIAASLALGYEMIDALIIANMGVAEGIFHAKGVNNNTGPIAATGFPKSHWPAYRTLSPKPIHTAPSAHFPDSIANDCGVDLPQEEASSLGLYPIVDSEAWLSRLLPLGVHTAQLRIKTLQGNALTEEIKNSIALARAHNCRLFINDHWQLAIELNAYGVHLGQEDLDTADLQAIARAGLRLGISNHSHFELVRSLAIRPSYIACGPTFATQTKDMHWVPHGIDGLKYWCESLQNSPCSTTPIVAIGGIDKDKLAAVASCGVSGVALISAITAAKDPAATTLQLLDIINEK